MVSRISLLKFVLVRWCLGIVSTLRVTQFTAIWGVDVVSLDAQKISFGMLVASTLAPCGITERSRLTWDHKNEDLGVQACISVDVGWIWGLHVESFWLTLEHHMCFLSCLFPGHAFGLFRGLNLDV